MCNEELKARVEKIYSEYMTVRGRPASSLWGIDDTTFVTEDNRIKIEVENPNHPKAETLKLYWADSGELISRNIEGQVMGMFGGVSKEPAEIRFTYDQIKYLYDSIKPEYRDTMWVDVDEPFRRLASESDNLKGYIAKKELEDCFFRIYMEWDAVPRLSQFEEALPFWEIQLNMPCGCRLDWKSKMFSLPQKLDFLVRGGWFHNNVKITKATRFDIVEEYVNKCIDFPIAVCDLTDEQIKMLHDDYDEFKAHGVNICNIESTDKELKNAVYLQREMEVVSVETGFYKKYKAFLSDFD